MPADGWVTMRHPSHGENGATAEWPKHIFDEIWAPKGWVIVDSAAAAATELLGKRVEKLDDLSKEELTSLASQKGIGLEDADNKKQLAEKVSTALRGETGTEVANG